MSSMTSSYGSSAGGIATAASAQLLPSPPFFSCDGDALCAATSCVDASNADADNDHAAACSSNSNSDTNDSTINNTDRSTGSNRGYSQTPHDGNVEQLAALDCMPLNLEDIMACAYDSYHTDSCNGDDTPQNFAFMDAIGKDVCGPPLLNMEAGADANGPIPWQSATSRLPTTDLPMLSMPLRKRNQPTEQNHPASSRSGLATEATLACALLLDRRQNHSHASDVVDGGMAEDDDSLDDQDDHEPPNLYDSDLESMTSLGRDPDGMGGMIIRDDSFVLHDDKLSKGMAKLQASMARSAVSRSLIKALCEEGMKRIGSTMGDDIGECRAAAEGLPRDGNSDDHATCTPSNNMQSTFSPTAAFLHEECSTTSPASWRSRPLPSSPSLEQQLRTDGECHPMVVSPRTSRPGTCTSPVKVISIPTARDHAAAENPGSIKKHACDSRSRSLSRSQLHHHRGLGTANSARAPRRTTTTGRGGRSKSAERLVRTVSPSAVKHVLPTGLPSISGRWVGGGIARSKSLDRLAISNFIRRKETY